MPIHRLVKDGVSDQQHWTHTDTVNPIRPVGRFSGSLNLYPSRLEPSQLSQPFRCRLQSSKPPREWIASLSNLTFLRAGFELPYRSYLYL